MFRQARTFVAILSLLLLTVSSVFANGKGATTETETFKGVTETFVDVVPCIGLAETTITYNRVVHTTTTPNGGFHSTETFTIKFTVDPLDESLPTFSGHATARFGFNDNRRTDTETVILHLVGKGSDGSRVKFHATAHITVVGDEVIVEFDKGGCDQVYG